MKLITIFVATALTTLGACATALEPMQTTFNPDAIAWSQEEGSNAINGSSFLRQNGGGVVTCAGATVTLTPYSEYAAERFTKLYGSKLGGYREATAMAWTQPLDGDERYFLTSKATTCDAQGNFEFSDIPDGDWYIAVTVTWTVGYNSQGGALSDLITLEGGETKKIVLTR